MLDELVAAELIDQIGFAADAEYEFRHPLVRAVAYESQLAADRAHWHRRVAETREQTDANAALIAEHLEAAGEMKAVYQWHMRAGVGRRTGISMRRRSVGAGRGGRRRSAGNRIRNVWHAHYRTASDAARYERFADSIPMCRGCSKRPSVGQESGDKASLALVMSGHTAEGQP